MQLRSSTGGQRSSKTDALGSGLGAASTSNPEKLASPAAPPPAQPTDPAKRNLGGSVTVRRWKRYGKDRLYANGADGLRLGYLDVATGEVVLGVADPTGTIAAQLRASRRALGGSPADDSTRG